MGLLPGGLFTGGPISRDPGAGWGSWHILGRGWGAFVSIGAPGVGQATVFCSDVTIVLVIPPVGGTTA